MNKENKQDYDNFQVGDWVTTEYWCEYLEIVEIEGRRIKIQEEDCTAWYDTHDHNFTKKGDVMKTEVKATNAVADEFQVGDIVWCLVYGEGEVTSVDDKTDTDFPILVLFKNGKEISYKVNGEFFYTAKRTLFFSEPKVEASVTRPFVPTLVGKRVAVQYYDKTWTESPVVITAETEDQLFTKDGDTWKSDLIAVYEVSPENLLKP